MPVSSYGSGGMGGGLFGVGSPLGLPDFDSGPPATATHTLGVGARGRGVRWRGAANYGRPPTRVSPGGPELPMPNPTRMSFTLRRDAGSEASVEFDQARLSAWVVEELTTDLWWWRYDPYRKVTEAVGRFNADNVDASLSGDRLRMSTSWVDYRELLDARITVATDFTYPLGTNVAAILAAVIPDNIDINAATLGNAAMITALGKTLVAVEVTQGSTVREVIDALRAQGAVFDYGVEMAGVNGSAFPLLRMYPGGRGTDRGVHLVDAGSGPSPISSWRRITSGADYATTVFYRGDGYNSLATMDITSMPTGPRDIVESGPEATQAKVDAAALRVLSDRSRNLPAWSIVLRPGFWQGIGHINVGDVVRVSIQMGEEKISGVHLVEEIGVDIDSNGTESVTLTIGKASASPNPRSRNSPLARLAKVVRAKAKK